MPEEMILKTAHFIYTILIQKKNCCNISNGIETLELVNRHKHTHSKFGLTRPKTIYCLKQFKYRQQHFIFIQLIAPLCMLKDLFVVIVKQNVLRIKLIPFKFLMPNRIVTLLIDAMIICKSIVV